MSDFFSVWQEVRDKVDRLELPFNSHGVDPYGVSKQHLIWFFGVLGILYRSYFQVSHHGMENVPARGRAMLIGNHSGGVALDGAIVLASLVLDHDPPRLAHAMADKFINQLPFAGMWSTRLGQLTGLPEHCNRLLSDDRPLIVFPEGARGTAKLYTERHSLVDFGTGFMRLAMQNKAPIIPFGFTGGGEAIPTVFNAEKLGAIFGAPYVPVTPYFFPIPMPVRLHIEFGEAIVFNGNGSEEDEVIEENVEAVKQRIAKLIEQGERQRQTSGAGAV